MKKIIISLIIFVIIINSQNLFSQCHNVALGKPATSSGAYPEGAYLVNDNNCNSAWNAGDWAPPQQWIQIDLINKYTINNIILEIDRSSPGDVDNFIYVSEDLNNWILVDSIRMNLKKYQIIYRDYSNSPIINVRGCKIVTTISSNWVAWYEIGIFSKSIIKASITPSGSLKLLKGDSLVLTAFGSSKFKWNTGDSTQSIVVKQKGKYTVTVIDSTIDTSCISLKKPCFDTASVYVDVYTNDLSLKTFFTDTSAIVGNEGFQIPIRAKFNKDTSYYIKNYQLEVQFNATCFLPSNLTRGKIIENRIVGKNRVLKILDSNITINKNNLILTEMIGTVLLADSIESNLHINSLEIPDKDVIIVKEDATFTVNTCAINIRRVQHSTPTEFTFEPNPANDKIEVHFAGDEEGTHILTINSIEGIKVKSIEWINKKNGKQDFIIDLKDYAAGIYYIVLTSPMKVISKKLVVIK